MTFLPGKQGEGWSGKHLRDLDRDVRWLREGYDVDTFLLLVEDHELRMFGVPNPSMVDTRSTLAAWSPGSAAYGPRG
jgi:hypothetical protein